MKKEEQIGHIRKKALAIGFDDARFCPLERGSALVLFAAYAPAADAEVGSIALSSYYIAANQAYQWAGELAQALQAEGVDAERNPRLPAKELALKTGGHRGRNGFYYHPALGSLVHIQTVALPGVPAEEAPAQGGGCLGCGLCQKACPVCAIGADGVEYGRCIRTHMQSSDPPEAALRGIYQLLGCEKCQSACPQNRVPPEKGYVFGLRDTLLGKNTAVLQSLAGKNMARPGRIVLQAAAVSANQKYSEVFEAVLAREGDPRFAAVCRYYKKQMGEGD